jgi:hypothetical protein
MQTLRELPGEGGADIAAAQLTASDEWKRVALASNAISVAAAGGAASRCATLPTSPACAARVGGVPASPQPQLLRTSAAMARRI